MADFPDWDVIVEERIRAAQTEGRFDNLPGYGKPIPGIDRTDPNWWIKQKLKTEGLSVLPSPLKAKLARERFFERLSQLPTESLVRALASELDEQIRRASLCALPGPPIPLEPVDIEAALAEWRVARGAA